MGASCSLCRAQVRKPSPPAIIIRNSVKASSNTEDQIGTSLRFEGNRKEAKPSALIPLPDPIVIREAVNAVVSEKPQTHWEAQTISMAIHRHSVLTDLTEDARDVIISRMKHYRLEANEVVFEQGAEGSLFFVIGSGALEVLVNDQRVNVLKSGDSFGELALLHNVPRSATVKTMEKSDLWGLDRKTFKEAVEQVNVRNYKENQAFLNSVAMLTFLTPQDKEKLLTALSSQRFFPGKQIVTEGEPGDVFYIIKEGTVACSANGVEIRKMHKGDYFGEQALLYNTVRTATVTAFDTVRVLSVGREQLVEVLGQSLQQVLSRNTLRIAFDQSEHLSKLTSEQKEKLIDGMTISSFSPGQVVVCKGEDLSKSLRVVVKGDLASTGEELKMFAVVGEDEIGRVGPVPEKNDLVAGSEVDMACIGKEEMERLLGGELTQITARNERLAALKRVSIFRGLPVEKLNELLLALQLESYPDQSIIVRQGEPGDALYIVDSGQVLVLKDATILRTITKNGFFGERSVLTNETRTASVMAVGDVQCLVLHRMEFMRVVDEAVSKLLTHRLELQDDTVTLPQLLLVKSIGRGMFGHVYAVTHRTKGTLYAVKMVTRTKIRAFDLFESLQLEREILLQLDHMFIMKLVKTFKDPTRVYFLMELVNGVDLFDALRSLGLVKETDSKFYTACLLLILEHLHERYIVYRDLKPENVVVDESGYLKLVDFGTAKVLKGRTFTTIGTPHYMAPEVILGKGYGLAVDLWSLGVMLYEFLCGGVPFGEEDEDPFKIYEKILRENLRWPSSFPSNSKVRDFTEILLSKNEALRNSGIPKLRKHKWFSGFEWEKLLLKQLRAPFVPVLKDYTAEVKASLQRGELISSVTAPIDGDEEASTRAEPPDWDRHF